MELLHERETLQKYHRQADPAEWAEKIRGLTRSIDGLPTRPTDRSEEHTSELQSLMRISYAVFCLKKKKNSISYLLLRVIFSRSDPDKRQLIRPLLSCTTFNNLLLLCILIMRIINSR